MPIGRRPEPTPEKDEASEAQEEQFTEAQRSIAERVQFWEEQDKINQEVIPRMIRQHEILAQHLHNHPDVPQISAVVDRALAGASRELRREYDDALASAEQRWEADFRKQRIYYQEANASNSRECQQTLQAALSTESSNLRSYCQAELHQAIAYIRQDFPKGGKRLNPILKIALIINILLSIGSLALIIYLMVRIL